MAKGAAGCACSKRIARELPEHAEGVMICAVRARDRVPRYFDARGDAR
jgi:hypothetical protein